MPLLRLLGLSRVRNTAVSKNATVILGIIILFIASIALIAWDIESIMIYGAIALPFAILFMVSYRNWRGNQRKDAACIEYMLKNPPQHDAERFTNLVSADHRAIATYLEYFLHELKRYYGKWNFKAVNNMVIRANKMARASHRKGQNENEKPFYATGPRGILQLNKKTYNAINIAIVGEFLYDEHDGHGINLIVLLGKDEVVARLEKAIENL